MGRMSGRREFSIKIAYNTWAGTFGKVPSSNLVIRNKASPRGVIIAWQRLPILDRLSKWGVVSDIECKLYQSSKETCQHVFIYCPVSKQIIHEAMKVFPLYNISSTVNEEILRVAKIAKKRTPMTSLYVIVWIKV